MVVGDWSIERLDRSHQREEFCCGNESLDTFARRLVSQYERRRLGRTFVVVRAGEKCVLGYYTLASGAIAFEHLPAALAKRLPKHPVPVVLLTRLATDQTVRGLGLGKMLLLDALRRSVGFSRELGIHAVEAQATDESAKRFYTKFGFVSLRDDDLHLFLPIKTVVSAFVARG